MAKKETYFVLKGALHGLKSQAMSRNAAKAWLDRNAPEDHDTLVQVTVTVNKAKQLKASILRERIAAMEEQLAAIELAAIELEEDEDIDVPE